MSTDELRRSMEQLPGHKEMSYYHRWAAGMAAVCLERGTFTRLQLDTALGVQELDHAKRWKKINNYNFFQEASVTQPSFRAGDKVRVKREDARVRWRKPHLRTPGYLFGAAGVVDRFLGCFPNPEREAFFEDKPGGLQPLYLVTFQQKDLWSSSSSSPENVEVTAEIYEAWIRKADDQSDEDTADVNVDIDAAPQHEVLDHGDHVHDTRLDTELEAVRRELLTEDPRGQRMSEV